MVDDRKRVTHTDVVIIGAGIGGLCCGAMLAKYGYRVTIVEAHSIPGGVAHSFEMDGYQFDSGPSSITGLTDPLTQNPLRHVLDLTGEEVPCTRWNKWLNYLPEGTFTSTDDTAGFANELGRFAGAEGEADWRQIEKHLQRMSKPFDELPPAALRSDLGALLTLGRYGKSMIDMIRQGKDFQLRFSDIIHKYSSNEFLKNLMDLESFIISGLAADETLAGVMAICFRDREKSTIDYPHGGMGGLIDGFVRGFTRHGGKMIMSAAVDEIIIENGRATGVQLKRGGRVMASKAVVSNASVWDTLPLIPQNAMPEELRRKKQQTRQTESFLHLHVGIDAADLPADLESHHVAVKSWDDIRSEQNVVIVSIPSLLDPTLAPKGKHNIHAYLAGNESYDVWEGLKRGDQKYKDLKVERSQRLWEVLEQIIPDVRKRVETSSVGTPLTIDRFCRRDRGNYGPAIKGKQTFFPGPHHLQIEGLVHCGDSTNPGIGLPSAAASGMAAAHAIAPIWKQWQSLEDLARFRKEGRNPRYTTFEPGEVIKHIKPNLMQAFA